MSLAGTLLVFHYGEDEDMVFVFKQTSMFVEWVNEWITFFFLVMESLNIGGGEMLDILLP